MDKPEDVTLVVIDTGTSTWPSFFSMAILTSSRMSSATTVGGIELSSEPLVLGLRDLILKLFACRIDADSDGLYGNLVLRQRSIM